MTIFYAYFERLEHIHWCIFLKDAMMLTLISATPSPYARKNRIALIEKGIAFELKSEIPWHSTTETPKYNPLEKLPILIFDDGRPPIY